MQSDNWGASWSTSHSQEPLKAALLSSGCCSPIRNTGLWLHILLGKESVVGPRPILSFSKAQSYLVMTQKSSSHSGLPEWEFFPQKSLPSPQCLSVASENIQKTVKIGISCKYIENNRKRQINNTGERYSAFCSLKADMVLTTLHSLLKSL